MQHPRREADHENPVGTRAGGVEEQSIKSAAAGPAHVPDHGVREQPDEVQSPKGVLQLSPRGCVGNIHDDQRFHHEILYPT